jgi:oligopeptide/dipeptide ABC transporter ATP-binding protein
VAKLPRIVDVAQPQLPLRRGWLSVENLSVSFRSAAGELVPAVKGVCLEVRPGEVVGLVGESGSGKSVTCLAMLRLLPRGAVITGHVRFGEEDVLHMDATTLQHFRATRARMIFQDPASSLNPLMRVGDQIVESIMTSQPVSAERARTLAIEVLERVGIGDPARRFLAYPHELSGGMLQRVMIAMAVVASPELLICDEPTTALDVTTEVQILELIRDLNRDSGTSVIFTTHDLGLVRELCDRVLVMYAGTIVETAMAMDCLNEPWHPYTRLLLEAEPSAAPAGRRLKVIEGSPPRPTEAISGCPFNPRCPLAARRCQEEAPSLMPVPQRASHQAACWITLQRGSPHV